MLPDTVWLLCNSVFTWFLLNKRSVQIIEFVARIRALNKSTLEFMLKYIEKKTGYTNDGPAWIAKVTESKSGRTVYFNGLAFRRGSSRSGAGGNHIDVATGDEYWISNVKKNGADRHWSGSGIVKIERAAVEEYLNTVTATALDATKHEITDDIVESDVEEQHKTENQKL